VRRAAESLQRAEIGTETLVRVGQPQSAIVEEAKIWSADLIVLGTKGHKGMKRWLFGSVAHHVFVQAACSVEVVRARSDT
jgi:nucleotide-binding universal stress UspA family protein